MGIISILSGLMASFLPETLNENLPQTIDDGDDFGSDMKYLSFANVDAGENDEIIVERKKSLIKNNFNESET